MIGCRVEISAESNEIARHLLLLLERSFQFWYRGAADGYGKTCDSATGGARGADENSATYYQGDATAAVAGRCGVHAGHDHAPRAGGGNDGADCFAYGK